jgi:5'-nucleotidase
VLANGEAGHFADGLSGAFLAGSVGGPLLLTRAGSLPSVTVAALADLHVRRVWVIGGTGAVSEAQARWLRVSGYTVHRLGGATRYDTNQLVLARTAAGGSTDGKRTALVATGADFPDALAGGPLAVGASLPVVLTAPRTLPAGVRAALTSRRIERVVLLGGPAAVSAQVEAAVAALGIDVLRLGGLDRGDTSRMVADWALEHAGFTGTRIGVASGAPALGGVDALAGAVHAGRAHMPLLVTESRDSARAAVDYTGQHADSVTGGVIYGGPDAVGARAQAAIEAPTSRYPVQILSLNDFHGNLEPPSGSNGRLVVDHRLSADGTKAEDVTVDAGGVAALAANLRQARAGQARTVTVAAGDLVGASPLISAAFHDEPTIEAMNALGLGATAVGNHEFDEGYRELLRLDAGGCLADGPTGRDNQNSCPDPSAPFAGASFPYLAANVRYAGGPAAGRTILPPYWVRSFGGGVRIGFIGLTLKETPTIVTQSGVAGLTFTDEVATANALVPRLRRAGVDAIVVLVHQGGTPTRQQWTPPGGGSYTVTPTYDQTCQKGGSLAPDSPILPIARGLDPSIDVVISGHTHQPYVCEVPDPLGHPRLVTSASSFGRLFTDIRLRYDTKSGDVLRAGATAANTIVRRDVTPDATLQALVDRYGRLVAPIAAAPIGAISTATVSREPFPSGESPLGDLIADAQLADPSVVGGHGTPVLALMNPGGIRADLRAGADGTVTYGAAFEVQPFNNYLVSMTLTGADLYDLLEQQWSGGNEVAPKVLAVSKGVSYTWDRARPVGSRVVPGSVKVGTTVVADDAGQTFRVVTNSFLADGGDNFTAFTHGKDRYVGGLDIDAFSAYLSDHSPYTPVASAQRITVAG